MAAQPKKWLRVWLMPLAILGAVLAWRSGWIVLPREYDPFAPLHVADPRTIVTGFKLRRLRSDDGYCSLSLESSQLDYLPVADMSREEGCVLLNTVRVARSHLRFNASFVASCPLAVSYAMFEHHGLQPLARKHFGQEVDSVSHLGSYACRNVRGSARRSEHATANALDLAALTLRDGRRIDVRRHWQKDTKSEAAEAAFLRDLRNEACRFFRIVLGPDYNAAHHDHFHLGVGSGFTICR
ncbi:extensin family protein [uncultured Ferrovibrio sp.]|jgi:Uncharacterized protein conserved in bacteria|uniref:extensin-like domain-containing protein n=1 Tax=uncultured Ferrovibrio sp. TaxID=1576913 RepID=UPI00260D04ED|nr:extensin family protein [uncultured Ferrovibrio sp.]